MKCRNGFARFGPNLIFNRESSEQPVICDGIENRLPIRRPCGCQFSTAGGAVTLASVNRRGPPTAMLFPFTSALAPRPDSASKFVAGD